MREWAVGRDGNKMLPGICDAAQTGQSQRQKKRNGVGLFPKWAGAAVVIGRRYGYGVLSDHVCVENDRRCTGLHLLLLLAEGRIRRAGRALA